MNESPEFTHVAIPKDTMGHLWAYLEQRPYKEVGHFMTAYGFQRVKLEAPKPTLAQEAPPTEEAQQPS